MLTLARRAVGVALATVTSVAAAQAPPVPDAPTIDQALERATFSDWRGRRDARALPDGSTLTVYAGETRARDGRDAVLRIGFVPRFGCAPGIELVLDADLARRLAPARPDAADPGPDEDDPGGAAASGLVDDDGMTFLVDGTSVGYPVLVDADDDRVTLAFNGNERERVTLRLQLDVGGTVSVGLTGAEPLSFSLLGSRRTLASVESLCLTHVPVEPGTASPDD